MSRTIIFLHDWLLGYRGGEKVLDALLRKYCDDRDDDNQGNSSDYYASGNELIPAATTKSESFVEGGRRVKSLYYKCKVVTLFFRKNKTTALIDKFVAGTSFLNWLPSLPVYYRYLLPIFPFLVKSINLKKFDPSGQATIVSTCHALIKGVPKVRSTQVHICYCFTPIRYAHDMQSHYIQDRDWVKRYLLKRIKKFDVESARNVDHFIAISKFVKDRIRRCYPTYSGEIPVVYPPVKTDMPLLGLEREDFYLFASALVPYKNPDIAIEACLQLGRKIVIIGNGPLEKKLRSKFGGRVKFLGRVPDEVLYRYLQTARGLLFPAIEDFGILPVEAMANGLPVIAPDVGGTAETVCYDPNSPQNATGILYSIGSDHVASLKSAIVLFETLSFDQEKVVARARLFDYRNFYQNWELALAKIAKSDVRLEGQMVIVP